MLETLWSHHRRFTFLLRWSRPHQVRISSPVSLPVQSHLPRLLRRSLHFCQHFRLQRTRVNQFRVVFDNCFNFLNIFIFKELALISFLSYIWLDHQTMPHLPPGRLPMVSTWSHWLIHWFESCLFLQSYSKRFVHGSFQVSATNIYIFRLWATHTMA